MGGDCLQVDTANYLAIEITEQEYDNTINSAPISGVVVDGVESLTLIASVVEKYNNKYYILFSQQVEYFYMAFVGSNIHSVADLENHTITWNPILYLYKP